MSENGYNGIVKGVASDIPVHCAHDKIIDIIECIPNPRNPNKHPDVQIALLSKIIKNNGWRQPIKISKRSGFIVSGHGRLEAAKLLGVEKVPVDYQNYDNEAQEWQDLIADNRLTELAETDNQILKDLLQEMDNGQNDMDMTGYSELALENLMTQFHPVDPNEEWKGMPEFGFSDEVKRSLIIHFESEEEIQNFSKVIGQEITEKTKFIWFPKKERKDRTAEAFVNTQEA